MHNSHTFSSKLSRGGITKRATVSPVSSDQQQQQQWQYPAGYDYQSYYAAWQNYQSQNPYYSYNQSYADYGNAYQYQTAAAAAAQFAPYQAYAAAAATQSSASASTQQSTSSTSAEQQAAAAAAAAAATAASSQQYYNIPYDSSETIIEEHDIPLDIEELNNETLRNNDDLYNSLEESRWLPIDGLEYPVRVKSY